MKHQIIIFLASLCIVYRTHERNLTSDKIVARRWRSLMTLYLSWKLTDGEFVQQSNLCFKLLSDLKKSSNLGNSTQPVKTLKLFNCYNILKKIFCYGSPNSPISSHMLPQNAANSLPNTQSLRQISMRSPGNKRKIPRSSTNKEILPLSPNRPKP